ncbi:MAG TPA: GNAT family N-acetyltransferase [Ignavibacteria bacterium]|nr:GNAT family N-acetyltransferase [Ignavibacteria bacterium]HMR40405.1 GNAT family N-acetyltransferase [Ignavibacteria bacterium]
MDIKIRRAKESDSQEIGNMYFDTVNAINSKDYPEEKIKVWAASGKKIEMWKKKISEQYFLVAETDKVITGISSIDPEGYLDFMYVHKDYQRMGIARALLNEIEKKAAEQNNKEIWAYVSITADPFFKKNGYEFSGEKIIVVQGVEFVDRILKKKLKH